MAISESNSSPNHVYRLNSRDSEWIRVLASQLVLIHHLNPWAARLLESPFLKMLDYFGVYYSVGWFWVYSGFVFDWVYNKSINQLSVNFKALDFSLKRIRRLYPLHVVTLSIMLLINNMGIGVPVLYTWKSVVANYLLLQNIFGGGSELSINPVMWSVSLELVAYAAFYCYVRYLGGTRLWALVVFVGALITTKIVGFGQNPATVVCLFFGGTILSWLYQGEKSLQQVLKLVVASIVLVIFGSRYSSFAPLVTISTMSLFIATGYFIKSNSLFQFLADRTYTLYVTHNLVIWVVVHCYFTNLYVAVCTYFLGSWGLSILIDQPVVKDIYSRFVRSISVKLTWYNVK
jgi:peptidoglycan/LPS O-acetylase OafA/YrhL